MFQPLLICGSLRLKQFFCFVLQLVKTGNMDLNVRKSVVHFVFGLEYAILKPVHVWMVAKKDGQVTSALKVYALNFTVK